MKPGYKQTEVGIIPQEWDVQTIGKTMKLVNGRAFKPGEWKLHGTPIIRIQNLNDPDGGFNYCDTPFEEKHRVTSGDVLFAWSGTTGTSFGARIWNGPTGVLNQHIFKVRADPAKLTSIYSFLILQRVQEAIEKQAHGFKASFVHVKKSDLVKVPLPIPPPPEQRAIAGALSDVDALLAGLDRLITKKRDLKQAAIQQLLTGQIRLPDFRGDWIRLPISLLAEYVDGVPTLGGEIGYVEIGDVDTASKTYDVSGKDKVAVSGAVKVPAGTLLISTVRPTRGAITVTKEDLFVSGAFCRLRSSNGLLFYIVCQQRFLSYLGENSIGGTYPTCKDETILGYECAVPIDPAEQEAIAAVLSDMDAELAALEARREKTRALKQGMMQALLTGKTRLLRHEYQRAAAC